MQKDHSNLVNEGYYEDPEEENTGITGNIAEEIEESN